MDVTVVMLIFYSCKTVLWHRNHDYLTITSENSRVVRGGAEGGVRWKTNRGKKRR